MILILFNGISSYLSAAFAQTTLKPKYSYLNEFSFSDTSRIKLNGPARVVSLDGRKGLNMTSIYSALQLKAHNMKEKVGAISMWVMSLEDLSTSNVKASMRTSNPFGSVYPFISDCSNPQDYSKAGFKMV